MMHWPALALAAALMALPLAALRGEPEWNPHLLILTWQDGSEEVIAATSLDICTVAAQALATSLWRIKPTPPLAMRCLPGNGFMPGSECIEGFNCGRQARR